jgi:ABC-type Fe3+/spermidine/putrescine transport system ATPase subunit
VLDHGRVLQACDLDDVLHGPRLQRVAEITGMENILDDTVAGKHGHKLELELKSYGAAKQEIVPGVEYRQHRYLKNRELYLLNTASCSGARFSISTSFFSGENFAPRLPSPVFSLAK